ncbi:Telomerase reverse transcriptase [Tolypocladium ophioglossoides CBS 100239]|uniref:Telomerase reverse transcriptase n=1 Tax=Tolypocladium ophioglossoides (strain CBS 100239) TaxID=1163406 RepID=A0A0L0N638_TOLOC|nr:Telomerase reverse transcriptase [Tolypocladium ophioglossoides CBS 100239]
MARGVKRKRSSDDASSRQCLGTSRRDSPVNRDLLQQVYPIVQTLRDYVLCKLPSSSRLRRKKIATLGQRKDVSEVGSSLARVLDTTLVCSSEQKPKSDDAVYQQYLSFSQRADESYVTLSDGISASADVQSEVCCCARLRQTAQAKLRQILDFVIWKLFQRETKATSWPKHLLCDGFRKRAREGDPGSTTIPGVYNRYPNSQVAALMLAPWPHLLALLGQSGERIMIDLLLDCSIYITIGAGLGNYYQLSGLPLSELELSNNAPALGPNGRPTARKPSDITLVRSRIFYARPVLTARGRVRAGFKHIHVLNRCPYTQQSPQSGELPVEQLDTIKRNEANTTKVAMYIFPRQFGLHNAFTSKVNFKETAQRFQDYELREEEIATLVLRSGKSGQVRAPKMPKRLRGAARQLVERLQILHARCSYVALLRHYCPTYLDSHRKPKTSDSKREPGRPEPTGDGVPQTACQLPRHSRKLQFNSQPISLPSKPSPLVDSACPAPHVSAFCQAVLSKIIPDELWGDGDTMCHNKTTFLHKVDHFIKLRQFESMTLHEISQGLKVADLAWLRPPGQEGQRLSRTDLNKRHEIFHEFLYYIFDSLLIPLIRSNFYVTESNTHRYEVFYFRHDVWRLIAEPGMAELKKNMLEEVKPYEAHRLLDSRQLGFSQVRLLPKDSKLRPIMNLKRRQLRRASSRVLGPSINSVLKPVHTVLAFEKDANPLKLGSSLFSPSDIYTPLKRFKTTLGSGQKCLYFAKIDVHAAFDTIPQAAVVRLMATVPRKELYITTKHAEVQPGERALLGTNRPATKAIMRWPSTALADGQHRPLLERLEGGLGNKRKNTIFVDRAAQTAHDTRALLHLLAEHVENNLVKVGKKYYRQSVGIPQGSALSTFLCSYFYADLEKRHLSFLNTPDCLLMRYIDDFLLITLDKSKAVKFVETMHRGVQEYGVEVNHKKTLVNFGMQMGDESVPKVSEGSGFPYCGTRIDPQTLGIFKDRERGDGIAISNSLTVQFGRSPGQNFQRKVLTPTTKPDSFKIQSYPMYYDTSHNSTGTVLQSLHGAFCEVARKMLAYIRCLSRPRQPNTSLITPCRRRVLTLVEQVKEDAASGLYFRDTKGTGVFVRLPNERASPESGH